MNSHSISSSVNYSSICHSVATEVGQHPVILSSMEKVFDTFISEAIEAKDYTRVLGYKWINHVRLSSQVDDDDATMMLLDKKANKNESVR